MRAPVLTDFSKRESPYQAAKAYKAGGKRVANECVRNVDVLTLFNAFKTWIKKKCVNALAVRERGSTLDCKRYILIHKKHPRFQRKVF